MTQIRIVGEDGKPVTPEIERKPLEPGTSVTAPVVQDIQANAVAEAMGLDKHEKNRYSDKIDTLLEYARANTKDHSPEGLKWAIRKLELKLGSTPFSEKKVSYLSRYAYLLLEKAHNKQQLGSFKK